MKPIDSIYDLICALSDTENIDQGETIKVGESCWAGVEHVEYVKRLDVEPKDQSTYRQKGSGHRFEHQTKKSRYCAKDIGVTKSTG